MICSNRKTCILLSSCSPCPLHRILLWAVIGQVYYCVVNVRGCTEAKFSWTFPFHILYARNHSKAVLRCTQEVFVFFHRLLDSLTGLTSFVPMQRVNRHTRERRGMKKKIALFPRRPQAAYHQTVVRWGGDGKGSRGRNCTFKKQQGGMTDTAGSPRQMQVVGPSDLSRGQAQDLRPSTTSCPGMAASPCNTHTSMGTHTGTHVHTHTGRHRCISTHPGTREHTQAHAHMHAHTQEHVCTYTDTRVQTQTEPHVYVHTTGMGIYVHEHAHRHTSTHTSGTHVGAQAHTCAHTTGTRRRTQMCTRVHAHYRYTHARAVTQRCTHYRYIHAHRHTRVHTGTPRGCGEHVLAPPRGGGGAACAPGPAGRPPVPSPRGSAGPGRALLPVLPRCPGPGPTPHTPPPLRAAPCPQRPGGPGPAPTYLPLGTCWPPCLRAAPPPPAAAAGPG